METYLYLPKPTLVIKKLGKSFKVQAEIEEKQLLLETKNARFFYDPDAGILIEVDNQQGFEEATHLLVEKKLPLMYEGTPLLVDLKYVPEAPDATGATGSHV